MAIMAYCTVGSNDLPKARAFYDALLGAFGMTPMMEHPSGGRVYGVDGVFCFGLVGPYDKQPATVGNGAMVGFRCESNAEVDAFYAKVIALGGVCEGPPGDRAPGLYFSYFRDLDGNKLSAYHVS